jgi:hypothetical protein
MAKLIIDDPSEFHRRVGILWVDDYEGMPIRPYVASIFSEQELDQVHSFLVRHPEFHLISVFRKSGVMVNRFAVDADGWLLGDGDADPELTRVTTERHWRSLDEALRAAVQARSAAKSR